jgi:hypothetical protein
MQEHYQYLKTIPAFREWFDYGEKMGFDLPEIQIHPWLIFPTAICCLLRSTLVRIS